MFLDEMVNTIGMESNTFECKKVLDRKEPLNWLKTIAGFANAAGGDFYIGVEDGTNKLIGFERKDADGERNYFNNQVNEHLTPRPQITIEFLPYSVRDKEHFVIHVQIQESSVKPVVCKFDGIPAIFMRRDGFTNGATYEEIIEMSIHSSKTQYDMLVSNQPYEKENFHSLSEFYSEHNNGKELREKALGSMGFFNEDGFLLNGAVLFQDDYSGDKTAVKCSLFSGINKGSERIITINEYRGNITSTIQNIYSFVDQRMNHSLVKLDTGRINIDAYPKRALFEGIVNAVAHRDYYLDGTQIQVDMFKDRLEITSPGGFYRGEQFGKTYDLSGIISKRRNELISNVLVACNVMEAAGTGFDKIMEAYNDADQVHRPYIYSTSDHFTLVLPDLTYSEGVTNSVAPILTYPPVPNGTALDEKIISFCYMRAHKVSEIAAYLGVADSTYLRKTVLGNLAATGYLEQSKIARSVYYRTNMKIVALAE